VNKISKTKFLSLAICSLFFSLTVHSDSTYFKATKSTPLEISLIYSSIYNSSASEQDIKYYNNITEALILNFSKLTKEEVFFISKSEIYKVVLSQKMINQDIIAEFKIDLTSIAKRVELYLASKQLSPFSSWIATSILSDFKKITNKGANANYKLKNIITPWLYYILSTDPLSFNTLCIKKAVQALLIIKNYTKVMLTLSTFNKKIDTKSTIQYFTKEQLSRNKVDSSSTFENFLNEENTPNRKTTQKFSDDKSWIPVDDSPNIITKPSPSYTPPATLPFPSSSWDLPIENRPMLFPTPEPNYTPPRKLPVPTNSW
jgi:hypothetical protein